MKDVITVKTNLSCTLIPKKGFSITYWFSALSGYFNSKDQNFRDISLTLFFSPSIFLSFGTGPPVYSSIIQSNADYTAVQKVLIQM